jgi:ABC-type multidrug transport system ATPase subunit
MNILTTLINPTKGISLLGKSGNIRKKQNILGYCPQHNLLWEKLTVYQHLIYFALVKVIKYFFFFFLK